jgi:TonB family protein
MTKEESPASSAAAPTVRPTQQETPSVASTPNAAAQPKIVEVPLVKGRTDELLEKARLAMRERRYTEPANDCALLFYRSALAADPGNGEATDGMTRIGNLLITRFEESMTASRYEDASEALVALKTAAPGDARLSGLEGRLTQSQINKALSESNVERAAQYLRQAQQGNSISADQISKWRTEITRRQDDIRTTRLVGLANDRIKDGRLSDGDDSAKAYLAQLKEVPGTNASAQRIQRDLNAAYLKKAREAQLANKPADADRWIAEARASGVSTADINAYNRDIKEAKQKAATAEAERFAGLVRDRIRDGRLTEPANDSAMYYLTQVNSSDPTGSIATTVGRELSAKLIDRAGSAARDGRTAQVDADLAAARRLGADPEAIASVQAAAARNSNKSAAITPRPTPAQPNKLKRVRYAPPEYPQKAFQQKLTGSVTVEFVVDVNGEPRDTRVVDSDPPEVFDKAALAAVKRWRYEPVVMNNVPTEVPTRMVIRFELPK